MTNRKPSTSLLGLQSQL